MIETMIQMVIIEIDCNKNGQFAESVDEEDGEDLLMELLKIW